MGKYARLPEEDIIRIANLMVACQPASELSAETHFDVSILIKDIKKYRTLSEASSANRCGRKKGCGRAGDLCRDCNQSCPEFTKIPECPKLRKVFPKGTSFDGYPKRR